MQQRLHVRRLRADGSRHCIHVEIGFRALERPLRVVDIAAEYAAPAIRREEGISLREPVFERTRSREIGFTHGTIAPAKLRRARPWVRPAAFVPDPFAV